MIEGYAWGGINDRFYYELKTGAVVGQITKTSEGIYEANSIYHHRPWTYIDDTRAREAVERCVNSEINLWKSLKNKNLERLDQKLEEKPAKKSWEIWK